MDNSYFKQTWATAVRISPIKEMCFDPDPIFLPVKMSFMTL